MEIIRNSNVLRNILDEEDLLLLENHSLDTLYCIQQYGDCKDCTILMLLIKLIHKYLAKPVFDLAKPVFDLATSCPINNVIEHYVKNNPAEINKLNSGNLSALDICITNSNKTPFIETIKILLNNGSNVNLQDDDGYTSYHLACMRFNLQVVRLILEYDGINIENSHGNYPIEMCNDDAEKDIVNDIVHSIVLLNTKN